MVNELLRLVLLAEIHDDLLDVAVAERLFGQEVLENFVETFPDIPHDSRFLGSGDRAAAWRRRKVSKEKFARAQSAAGVLKKIPWLLFAGVTGSVAFGNAKAGDDIDLFVITEDGRLWLTRMTEILLHAAGKRRTFGTKDLSDKICINAYVCHSNMQIRPAPERRWESALELLMMKPLVHPFFYAELLAANCWIYDYFSCPSAHKSGQIGKEQYLVNMRKNINIPDQIAMEVQVLYMKLMRHPWRKASMSPGHAFFWDRSAWTERSRKLQERLEEYGV